MKSRNQFLSLEPKIIVFIFFFINKYGVNSVIWDISGAINNIPTTEVITATTGAVTNTWEIVSTWENIEIPISSDIDIVYETLTKWKAWYDYSAVSFKPQIKKWSEWWYIDSNILKDEYLPNNRYSIPVANDIKWWYLYIKTRQPLKFISSIGVYQPITIWTNLYDTNNRRIYGRLDTKKSLPVYEWNQEFLYKLDNIPIAKSTTSNWLSKKVKEIEIGGFVWDVSGNGIDKIIFIRQR